MSSLRCFVLLACACCPPSLCAGEFSPLSPPLEVRPFALTERSGNVVRRDDLRGKVWIAHFFYPTCQGPCTKTVPVMRKVHEVFAGKPDIVLVSVALTGDEPSLLQQFANDHRADPSQWLFLTDPDKSDAILDVVQKSFFQTAVRKPDGKPGDEIDHTTSLLVIDRQGMMRGYIDGTDPANVPALVAKVRQVAGVLCPVPRWSSSTTRYSRSARSSQSVRPIGRPARPPGPPCRKTSHGSGSLNWPLLLSVSAPTTSRANTLIRCPSGRV